jgi:hypothetical protein
LGQIIAAVGHPATPAEALHYLMIILGDWPDKRAVEILITKLDDHNSHIRTLAVEALGKIGDDRGIKALSDQLSANNIQLRSAVLRALLFLFEDDIDRQLLYKYLNIYGPLLDPQKSIGEKRVSEAAEKLNLSVEEIRRRYEAIAQRIPIKLSWQATRARRKPRPRKKAR